MNAYLHGNHFARLCSANPFLLLLSAQLNKKTYEVGENFFFLISI